jgi:hypothetical protein
LHVPDTDTLSLLQEGHPAVLKRVAGCPAEDLAITVISVEEQLSGWYRRLRPAKKAEELAKVYDRLTATARSLARLPILSFISTLLHRPLRPDQQRFEVVQVKHQAGHVLEQGAEVVGEALDRIVPRLVVDLLLDRIPVQAEAGAAVIQELEDEGLGLILLLLYLPAL